MDKTRITSQKGFFDTAAKVPTGDWTVDRTIRVRFPAYPHREWAL